MALGQLPAAPLHIVLALLDGEKHGYRIMQDVEELSDGAVRLGPGTLYGSLKRLLADGLIEEVHRPDDQDDEGGRRRSYRLTAAGQGVASAELARLSRLVRRVQRLRPQPGSAS